MSLSEKNELTVFIRLFKKNINKNKKLEPRYFKRLSKIVRDGEICQFLTLFSDFTNNEAIVIGRAVLKNKMEDVDDLLKFLTTKRCKYHIIILTCLLCKGKRFTQPDLITNYIKLFFDEKNNLNFYKLILVACRKYKISIDQEIITFCLENEHPVLKEVVKEYNLHEKIAN